MLSDVLALPSFRAASVEVLTGDAAATPVRWVHSSEVYEMGGLLAGGELLLTTGLGLYGRTAGQLAAYIDQIADAGCAALAMEIGRSFFAVPPELVTTARRRDLALLVLHAVVPFERMVEDFHDLLIRRTASPRAGEPIWQELLGVVVAGQALTALLDAVARLAGCAAEFVDADGRTVARGGPAGRAAAHPVVTDVRGPAGSLGRLVLQGAPSARRTAVAGRAAVAVALELGRHAGAGGVASLAQSVIVDLAAGLVSSAGDLADRMTAAGLPLSPGQHLLAAAVDVDVRTPADDLVPAVREATAATVGPCLAGSSGQQVIVLARGWPRPSVSRVRQVFGEMRAVLAAGGEADRFRTVGVAMPVLDPADLGAAVTAAREVVRIARRLGVRSGVVLARDVGVERLLSSGSGPLPLVSFVDEQLGPLIRHDRQHSSDLVRTLDAFLRCGSAKASAAQVLGIRRQSLYGRLARIERLLGVSLDEAPQVMCLGVAMVAWRLRSGLDPQAAFDRPGVARAGTREPR